MSNGGKVVWSEGMFLRTQHFQQQDHRTERLVAEAMAATPYQGFGFRSHPGADRQPPLAGFPIHRLLPKFEHLADGRD